MNILFKKVYDIKLKMFRIIIASFKRKDKKKIQGFLEKNFSLINFSISVVLEMRFFIQNNIKVNFLNLEFFWKT